MDYGQLTKSLLAYKNFCKDFMSDRLSQAYLFMCPDRLTNKHLISCIANLVTCQTKNGCGVCPSCQKANAGTHPDILTFPKNKNFVVEDASSIYDTIQVKPMYSAFKVYVILDFDLATEQAQNKMLKIIEEPPANVLFLICASNENKVLKTIHSRVQKIYVEKFDKQILQNYIEADVSIKQIALANGDGYLGKTLYIAQNLEFINCYNNMQNLVLNLKNSGQIPSFCGILSSSKQNFETALYILSDFFRDILMLKLNKENLVKNTNLILNFNLLLPEYSENALVQILKNLNYFKQKLDANVNLTTLADGLLLNILEVKFLCK